MPIQKSNLKTKLPKIRIGMAERIELAQTTKNGIIQCSLARSTFVKVQFGSLKNHIVIGKLRQTI